MTGKTSRIEAETSKKAQSPKVSVAMVILWTLLFQLAWHYARIPLLFSDMAMWDSDDFLRLHQVRNWMAGAGWFDVQVPRMAALPGTDIVGDMHWSRLVDVPIAGMIWFFDLFTTTQMAEKLAIVIWPNLLLLATVFTLIAVTEKLFPPTNRLLVVIFAVTCITALAEFAPGRIDHHSVQILLFSLTLLGLVTPDRPWGRLLAGASIAASVAIGLDVFLTLVFILAWLGFEWALGLDPKGRGLARTAIAMAATALILYPVSIPPGKWLVPACDAFSLVYLVLLLSISGSFLILASLSGVTKSESALKTALVRIAIGAVLAASSMVLLYSWFPQCQAGPMSTISAELDRVWLSKVVEARGLIAYLSSEGMAWIAVPIYILVVITVGALLMRKHKQSPGFFALWGSLVICFALGFIQVRAYRVGVFAGIPICVMATQLASAYFSRRFAGEKWMAMASSALVGLFLMTPFWVTLGNLAFPQSQAQSVSSNIGKSTEPVPAWKNETADLICNRQSQFEALNQQPKGRVLSDLNSGPSILVFTPHAILAGNYHRNGDAILDNLGFFNSRTDKAREIIEHWKIDYIAFRSPLSAPKNADREIMGIRILEGRLPPWLQKVSNDTDRVIVAKVVR